MLCIYFIFITSRRIKLCMLIQVNVNKREKYKRKYEWMEMTRIRRNSLVLVRCSYPRSKLFCCFLYTEISPDAKKRYYNATSINEQTVRRKYTCWFGGHTHRYCKMSKIAQIKDFVDRFCWCPDFQFV